MPILVHVVHKDIFLGWCLSYLRLVEARDLANANALTLLTTTDLLSLDVALQLLMSSRSRSAGTDSIQNAMIVSYDLDN